MTEAGAPASRFIGLTVIALAFIYWWIAVALFLVLLENDILQGENGSLTCGFQR